MTSGLDRRLVPHLSTAKSTHADLQRASADRRAANDALTATLRSVAAELSEAERSDLARDLYWNHHEVDEEAIASGLGYRTVVAMIAATNYQPTKPCPDCNRLVAAPSRDLDGLAGFVDHPHRVCRDCRDKLRAEFERQMREEYQ